MLDSPPEVPPGSPRRAWTRHAEWFGLAVLCGLFALFLHLFFVPTFSGTDPNGYHAGARILAETGRLGRTPTDDYEFIGRMWVVNAEGVYHAKYPPFYPALCAALIRWGGIGADLWINPLLALLTLPGMFFLARGFGLGRWSLAAAALLALNPIFALFALQQVSHASGLFVAVWGMVAWRAAMQADGSGPRGPLMRLAAGLLVGCATGIRYTDALLALPLLAEAAWHLRRRNLRPLAVTALGLALPWGILAVHHALAFGGPLTTGYALTGEQTGFGMAYFLDNLRLYLRAIVETGLGPLAVLVLPGIVAIGRRHARHAALVILWLFPLLFLYMAYYWAPGERHVGFLRFLLPVFVPAILLAVAAVRTLAESLGRGSPGALLVAAGALIPQAAWGLTTSLDLAEPVRQQGLRQQATVAFVQAHVPPGSVVIAGQSLQNYLDYLGGWQLYPDEIFMPQRLRQMTSQADDDGPSGLQRRRSQWLKEHLADVPGREYRARIDALLRKHLDARRRIFLVAPANEFASLRLPLLRHYELGPETALAVSLPDPRLPPVAGPRRHDRRGVQPEPAIRLTMVELIGQRLRPLRPDEERDLLRADLQERQRSLFRQDGELPSRLAELDRLRCRLQALDAAAQHPKAPARK